MTRERSMLEILGPVAAITLIAHHNPDLSVPGIEFTDIYNDRGALGYGLRLHLHEPRPGVYERWAHLIGSDDPDSHTDSEPTSRGTVCRRTYGTYADIPVEVTAFLPAEEWSGADTAV